MLGSDAQATLGERDDVFRWAEAYVESRPATCPGCGAELRPEDRYRHRETGFCRSGATHRPQPA